MSKAKHAAAPWARTPAQLLGSIFRANILSAVENRLVAEVYGRTKAEANANAAIVDVAPELLALCETIEAHCAVTTGTHGPEHAAEGKRLRKQMVALIAKAKE